MTDQPVAEKESFRSREPITKPLRLLLIEDSEDDALLIVDELQRGGYEVTWDRVETAATVAAALQRQTWDTVICDWVLPHLSASDALDVLKQHGGDARIIVVSGEIGEEVAVTAMKSGVHDFVDKHKLTRLVPAIERELREADGQRARVRAEEALQASELRYRDLFETAQDGIFIIDADTGQITDINQLLLEWLGYPREEILAKPLWEVSPFKDIAADQEAFHELRKQEYIRYDDLQLETKSGQQIAVDFVSSVFRVDGKKLFHCNVRDIRDRKRLAEQLAVQSTALAAAANAIVITDSDGTITWVNPAFARLTGYATTEVIGRTPALLKSGVHDRSFYEQLWATICAGQVWCGEIVNRRKDGSLYTEEMTITPVRQNGVIGHFIAIKQDVSERKRAEAAIGKLNAELERRVEERTTQLAAANRELEAFSYSVSHDLRAPLRHIDGFSRMLLEKCATQLDAEGRRLVARIQAGARRMGHLVEALLSLSRVTRGDLAQQVTNLSDLAQSIAADLQKNEPNRQVVFVMAPGLVAEGDRRLLRAVLENLFGNAWKYTSKHPTARIEFGMIEGESRGVYFVRDDGPGFDAAQVGKLFAPFRRLHTESEFDGTGIGLATVQRIVHRHGGRVWAESTPGQGATFYFTLRHSAADIPAAGAVKGLMELPAP